MPAAKPRPTQPAETDKRKLRIGLIWWWCVNGVVHRCRDLTYTRSVLSSCWWLGGWCNSHTDPLTRPQSPLAAPTAALSALLPAPLPCPACPALAAPYTARPYQLLIPSTQTPGHHWTALIYLPIACRNERTPPCPYRSDPPPLSIFFSAQPESAGRPRGVSGPRRERNPSHRATPKTGSTRMLEGRWVQMVEEELA